MWTSRDLKSGLLDPSSQHETSHTHTHDDLCVGCVGTTVLSLTLFGKIWRNKPGDDTVEQLSLFLIPRYNTK